MSFIRESCNKFKLFNKKTKTLPKISKTQNKGYNIAKNITTAFKKLLTNPKKVIKYFLVTVKIFFFNIVYYLFPIYLIWIVFIGFFHMVGLYPLIIDDLTTFYQFTALMGISLGVLQFILKRNDEKVIKKIHTNVQLIKNVINDETHFNKFMQHVENNANDDDKFYNWFKNKASPNAHIYMSFLEHLGRIKQQEGLLCKLSIQKKVHLTFIYMR